MMSRTLGFHGDMSRRSLLALWRSLVFPEGHCQHGLEAICESGHNNLFKACVRYFLSIFIFSPNDSPLKNYEKCFLFHLKSSFGSRDI